MEVFNINTCNAQYKSTITLLYFKESVISQRVRLAYKYKSNSAIQIHNYFTLL